LFNGCVKALNNFLSCLLEYNLIDPDSVKKCSALPDHFIRRRGAESVISPDEANKLRSKLAEIRQSSSEVFWLLTCTGLRLNEALSLRRRDLFAGEIEHSALAEELNHHGIKYHGYLVLESQIDKEDPTHKRRKPLKGCRTISSKNSRVIPIEDKALFNLLVLRYKAALDGDSLLFADVDDSKLNRDLVTAEEALHYSHRSLHCCRHSYLTHLAGRTRSFFLVRMISGHKSAKNFEGYIHLFDQISRQVRAKTQTIELVS
jgi:integrase